jgi:hypothetical protein
LESLVSQVKRQKEKQAAWVVIAQIIISKIIP